MFDPKKHLISIKGKDYLPVAARILWFREDHKDGDIQTEIVNYDPLAVKANIIVQGNSVASGHGSAEKKPGTVWSGRELEKAETAAIGRALAHAGYGTQFTGEDEGEHLADSPVETPTSDGTKIVDVLGVDAVQAVVSAGFFENDKAAAQVLSRLFPKQRKAPMQKIFDASKQYRSNKVETGDTDQAIELTLEGMK